MGYGSEYDHNRNHFGGNSQGIWTKLFFEWYESTRCVGAAPAKRIWAVAQTVRDNHSYGDQVTDEELLHLVYRTSCYCFKTFDAQKGKQEKRVEDRFVQWFQAKLRSFISDDKWRWSRKLGREHEARESRHPRDAALAAWIRKTVANLASHEEELLRRHYWNDEPFSRIGPAMGLAASSVERRHKKILARLRLCLRSYLDLLDSSWPNYKWCNW